MLDKKYKELEESHKKIKNDYQLLLQKNQNDLVKIRLKQKTLNEIIGKLQQDKINIRTSLTYKIQQLTLQIQQLKSNLQKSAQSVKNKQVKKKETFLIQQKQQNNKQSQQKPKQKQIIQIKLQQLQQKLYRKDKQNTQLLSTNKQLQSANKQLKAQKIKLQTAIKQLQSINQNVRAQNNQMLNIANIEKQSKIQVESINNKLKLKIVDHQAESSQHENQNEKNSRLLQQAEQKVTQLSKRLSQSQKIIQKYKSQLNLTNIQFKNNKEKMTMYQTLLSSKTQQTQKLNAKIQKLEEEYLSIKMLLKSNKLTEQNLVEVQNRNQDLLQEVSLLKEMIKSCKTMLKVKQMQNERLKAKIVS